MKKNDAVFQLIDSLTRGEKRNFRMLAQLTSGDKKYLQLFDAMDGLSDYDEAKILKRFKKEPAFQKQFAYNKNYLYNSILNALAYFHKGLDAELSSLTMQVKILLEKNLYYQARKLLRKAKDKIVKQEKFEELLKLLRYEIEILKRTENIKLLKDAVREVEFQEKVTLEKIANLMEYRRLDTRTFILMKTFFMARHENELEMVEKVAQSQYLQDENVALSGRAKILFNEVHRRVAVLKGNESLGLSHSERALELYRGKPAIIEDEKILFLMQVSSSARHHLRLHGIEEASSALMQLREIKVATPQERVFKFRRFYAFMLGMYNDSGDVFPADLMAEMLKELKLLKNDLAISAKMNLFYSLSVHNLIHGDHKESLKWMNEFLNHPRSSVRTDLQAIARLINLIIHFELGNFDLIEYNVKSTYRFIYKQDRLHKYERRFLSFIRKAINLGSKEELKNEFYHFGEDLKEICKEKFEARAGDYFSMQEWISSKIEGITFAQAIQGSKGFLVNKEESDKKEMT